MSPVYNGIGIKGYRMLAREHKDQLHVHVKPSRAWPERMIGDEQLPLDYGRDKNGACALNSMR